MTEPSGIEFHDRVPAPSGRSTGGRVAMVAGADPAGRGRRRRRHGRVGAIRHRCGSERERRPGCERERRPRLEPEPHGEPRAAHHGARSRGIPLARRLRPAGRARAGRRAWDPAGSAGVTISAINGSDISLKTVDGWTRTISVESTTTITKGGATIAVGDLAVGDEIRFAQKKAADGSYDVTAIVVVLPTVVGEVTAVDGDTIKVTQPGGTSATIHVDSHTTYRIDGATGSLSGVKVGAFLIAQGSQRADGSLDAAAIQSGLRPGVRGHGGPGNVKPSPAPSSQGG